MEKTPKLRSPTITAPAGSRSIMPQAECSGVFNRRTEPSVLRPRLVRSALSAHTWAPNWAATPNHWFPVYRLKAAPQPFARLCMTAMRTIGQCALPCWFWAGG